MTIEHIIQAIKTYDTIIIHRHVRPDPDAIGSQAALKTIIQHTFPEKHVYMTGEMTPSLSFLADMDDIPDDTYAGALVIVCDTANTARISDERFHKGDMLIKIDHHPNVDDYGDIAWIDTDASSTSEMIYELFLHGKAAGLQFSSEAARLIYAGIVGDTGRFLFPSTTTKTFRYAAELVAWNFDRTALYDAMYKTQHNIARLRGYILQQYSISPAGMSSVKLTKELLQKFDVDPIDTGQFVGVLGDVEGIKAWVFFIEEDDIIRVRLRSKGPVVNDIAAQFNGGGHPLAAGASVDSWSEAEHVVAELEAACEAYMVK
ncbi:DHH family phosphoesterase [Lentibacillus saliphilus]|uniref:DHH family phosphoesterase n=1 Tax=Lentibacillus saliphilus TaxID=2737028 RepID=UPI001C304833|nr:bifunctional oligoribonuclease/PAP phosphatase NrnA [Lentibacillus saliphilus]